MTACSHRVGALAASATVAYGLGMTIEQQWLPLLCMGTGALIGSLFPDADTPYSRIGRRYVIFLWPFYVFQFLLHILVPQSYADRTFRHRGIFHYPFTWLIILTPFLYWFRAEQWQIPMDWMIGFTIGVISHLILDFFSGGIALAGPFYLKKCKPMMKIRTGGFAENVACVCMAIYSVLICMRYLV